MAPAKQLRNCGLLAAIAILPLVLVGATLFWWELKIEEQGQYSPVILDAARRYGVPKSLIRAVIWRESRFDESAYGAAEERGLMQVTPAAGLDWARSERMEHFDPKNLFDPRTNVFAGTWYLSRALKRWEDADNPLPFALAEYNAGPVHARRWASQSEGLQADAFLAVMDFPTTRQYIQDVTERMAYYQKHPSPSPWEFLQDQLQHLRKRL